MKNVCKMDFQLYGKKRLAVLYAIKDALEEMDKRLFVLTSLVEAMVEDTEEAYDRGG